MCCESQLLITRGVFSPTRTGPGCPCSHFYGVKFISWLLLYWWCSLWGPAPHGDSLNCPLGQALGFTYILPFPTQHQQGALRSWNKSLHCAPCLCPHSWFSFDFSDSLLSCQLSSIILKTFYLIYCCFHLKSCSGHLRHHWDSRAVQWLGLHASTAVGTSLIPGWGTKISQAAK